MEEKQIQEFVHRVSQNEDLRKELATNPDEVIMREGFSPRVERVLKQFALQLSMNSISQSYSSWL